MAGRTVSRLSSPCPLACPQGPLNQPGYSERQGIPPCSWPALSCHPYGPSLAPRAYSRATLSCSSGRSALAVQGFLRAGPEQIGATCLSHEMSSSVLGWGWHGAKLVLPHVGHGGLQPLS